MSSNCNVVSLVPFDRTILERSFHWLNDPEIRFLTDTPVVTPEAQEAWFAGLPARDDYAVWGVLADGEPVGVCGIKHMDDGEGEYFGYIGEKAYWGRGVGRRMMVLTEGKARERGLSRLGLTVLNVNERALGLYGKCGYRCARSDEKYTYMSKPVMIPYCSLKEITALHADEIHEAVNRVVDSGWYLQGNEWA